MGTYTAVNGTKFTDDDIERWAEEEESDVGYVGEHVGPSRTGRPGRPAVIGPGARSVTVRLDAARRAKLEGLARKRHISVSEAIRDLIDAI